MATQIRASALETARHFFEERGAFGFEGTAMLAGKPAEGITRCFVPHQLAHKTSSGVAVEVTDQGKLELASTLELGELWLARIHSHPYEAFHSQTDDSNAVLTAEGAFSIVVPFLGLGLRRGLTACAVYIHRLGSWIELSTEGLADQLVVIDG